MKHSEIASAIIAAINKIAPEALREDEIEVRKGADVAAMLVNVVAEAVADRVRGVEPEKREYCILERHPTRGAKAIVKRDGMIFTATPCYGMHEPWWVVMTMEGEVAPVPFRDDDMWSPL